MVNYQDISFDERSHYALLYSMIVTGVRDYMGQFKGPMSPVEEQTAEVLRMAAYDLFDSQMARLRSLEGEKQDKAFEWMLITIWRHNPKLVSDELSRALSQ